ncbi:MAG: DNA-3-methyladenine glycosylase [Sphingobacteriales bacterium]|nr:MAG: DNA-3-methyladenine glycosylase [Sphingobacteriales bacterium]
MDEPDDKPGWLADAARLQHAFFDRDTETVARELLGCLLVHRSDGVERIGRIVETEAYLGVEDLAAHSSKGITPRTRIMFGPAGFAYVYLIYGMHHCVNVVTGPAGEGSAVLLRALEPVRHLHGKTSGPGLLWPGPLSPGLISATSTCPAVARLRILAAVWGGKNKWTSPVPVRSRRPS